MRRERRWGLLGGLIGAMFGIGSALIAVYVEGASWSSSTPYPHFFANQRLLTYDYFLVSALLVPPTGSKDTVPLKTPATITLPSDSSALHVP